MIAFLNGTVAAVLPPQTAYIDVAGVGYAVAMPGGDLGKLAVGEEARVLTYLSVTENGIALFGFLSEEERALFEKLIGVSKVGPKMALAALSTFSPAELADAIASQADLHALYGGVVPEIASRKHVEAIAALTDQALRQAGCEKSDIDAVAVTYAPGLIGAVLVGLSFAKSVAFALGVPLIPVHHIRGHIAANYLAFPELEPPFLALAISGGNTMIVDVRDYTDMEILGATRDDAAGECFDKAARVLGLPYPGGAPMDALARQSPGGVYTLPHAHVDGAELDMSFSGLKTAVVNLAHHAQQVGESLDRAALARDFAQAVSDTLVPRAMEAAKQTGRTVLCAAGGVAANSVIREDLRRACEAADIRLYLPPLKLCGDNGAMIGAQGYYEYLAGHTAGMELNAYATRDIAD